MVNQGRVFPKGVFGGIVMKLWIARDQNGDLFLYPIKPDRYVTEYYVFFNGDDWWNIDSDLFPEVTFENSPQEVELKSIEK